ncbi:putative HNH endonuclease [Klebsiella phage DP]|nr:MAG: ICEA protein [Bacteriophage sp.]UYA58138.1 putative HNH endonuclease [Klebsiella phage DP]
MATKTVLKTAEHDECLGSSTLPSSAKYCNGCATTYPISEFYTIGKYKDKMKYKPLCKRCENKRRKERNLEIIKEVFGENLCCSSCGYDKCFAALDFHHVDAESKDFNIAKMLLGTPAKEKLAAELKKCMILCANCHREHHAEERLSGR